MKVCPQCSIIYPEDYVFCLNDGTTLKDEDNEQETLVQKKVVFDEKTLALSSETQIACPSCATTNQAGSGFCRKCGAALGVSQSNLPPTINAPQFNFQSFGNSSNPPEIRQVEPFTFAHLNNAQQQQQQNFNETTAFPSPQFTPPNTSGQIGAPAKSNKSLFLIIGVLFAVIVAGAVAWLTLLPNPLESRLDKAISGNKLFEPAGDNAYELYRQMKKEGVDAKILKKYEDRILPLLTEKPKEILRTVTEPGITEKDLNEWQTAAKMLEWTSEMQPQDTQSAAKAAYCKGRVNYLSENKQQAIEDWKKAANLDKKWALPLNGIGLIYNELKNYETARTFLQQAIDREPNWAFPYNNYGTSLYNQKMYREAMPYYQKAAQIVPRWARAHAWLASVAKETGDYTTCVSELEMVLAPDAVGAGDIKMDDIRRKKTECENLAAYSAYSY